jgi:hypothetical protein
VCGIWVEMSDVSVGKSGRDQFGVILVLGFLKRAMLWNFCFGNSGDSTWHILS